MTSSLKDDDEEEVDSKGRKKGKFLPPKVREERYEVTCNSSLSYRLHFGTWITAACVMQAPATKVMRQGVSYSLVSAASQPACCGQEAAGPLIDHNGNSTLMMVSEAMLPFVLAQIGRSSYVQETESQL
jgi:hypothetical protein